MGYDVGVDIRGSHGMDLETALKSLPVVMGSLEDVVEGHR